MVALGILMDPATGKGNNAYKTELMNLRNRIK